MAAVTPPPLQGPTAKEKKYDRQLRLWGANGQAALEEAHVLLINAGPGAVGIETLKNLVLPGIGHFTILDSVLVVEADLGVNFFLTEDSLGKSRAEETCKYLQELNPDVEGHYIHKEGPEFRYFLIQPDSLLPYSLIIIASPDVHPALRLKITEHASRSFTPLFYVHSVGFFAHFSMHLPPVFPIADTHPDPSSTSDLRLLKPWPALTEYALSKTKDLDALNDHEHGHIPYLLLLLHYLEEWKNTHNGKAPATYKEKTSFKELIEAGMRRQNPEGGEENFEQALGAVLKNMNEPVPNSAVLEVFKESEKQPEKSAKFWTIAKAIKLFYEKWGVLPVPGTVPDMKAQSTDYISLQNVYKDKAREDVKEVYATARSLDSSIDEREVEAFCKNAAHVKLIRGRPFNTARGDGIDWGGRAKSLASSVTDKSSLVDLYIAFLAYDEFHSLHSQAPGTFKFDDDKQELKGKGFIILRDLFKQAGLGPPEEEDRVEAENRVGDYCLEFVRARGGELHNISSLWGGVVSQEIIKVVTKQYVPVDNTMLFDGIQSTTSSLRL